MMLSTLIHEAAPVILAAAEPPAAAAPVQKLLSFLVSYVFPVILGFVAFKILVRSHQSEMSKNVTTIGNVAIAAVVLALGAVIWGFGDSVVKAIFA